jgi:hypothetical protein
VGWYTVLLLLLLLGLSGRLTVLGCGCLIVEAPEHLHFIRGRSRHKFDINRVRHGRLTHDIVCGPECVGGASV